MQPCRVGSVLFGADAMVAAWVSARMPVQPHAGFGPCAALGILRDDRLMGGVVFSGFVGHDIQVSGAVDPSFRCSPAALRLILAYPFLQLGCARLSLRTGRRNKRARAFAERLGFRIEGVVRKGLNGSQDAMLYGLLRADCRYLKGLSHG